MSGGQLDELPVQTSATSQNGSLAGLQTVVAAAKVQSFWQHELLAGSQRAPGRNLQVAVLQQVEFTPWPGSQSSPASTIPFPHCWREMVARLGSGSTRHVVLVCPALTPIIMEPGRKKNGCPDEKRTTPSAYRCSLRYKPRKPSHWVEKLGSSGSHCWCYRFEC
jgi:hypothetical protein